MHMIYVFKKLKFLGCLHDPISYTSLGLHLIFLVEYMNRITFGAFDLTSPFFTPRVFLFSISILFV